jgi:hypothetical protein
MARADIRVDLGARGASLRTIARELRGMDDAHVRALFRRRMGDAAKPFPRAVRASVLAIPVTGKKHTGLRARIALCAETASWESAVTRSASVAVEMNPKRMPPGEMGLPLYMEGVPGGRINHARWRHPVYGKWLPGQPNQPSHPYFYQAASGFGRAAGEALKVALDDITKQISG